jgi:hypothetical protein
MNKKSRSKTKRTTTRSVLRLPDLEHAKTAVLNSLTSPDAQRGYRHAIDEFVDWYCSEPRLALARSTFASALCAVLPTKRRTVAFLALTWQLVSAG